MEISKAPWQAHGLDLPSKPRLARMPEMTPSTTSTATLLPMWTLLALSPGVLCQSQAASTTRPTAIVSEDKPENAVKIRAALTRALAQDSAQQKKTEQMLSFYLGGDDGFLGGPLGSRTRDYAEQLVWLELVQQEHEGRVWDQILDRRHELDHHLYLRHAWHLVKEVREAGPGSLEEARQRTLGRGSGLAKRKTFFTDLHAVLDAEVGR